MRGWGGIYPGALNVAPEMRGMYEMQRSMQNMTQEELAAAFGSIRGGAGASPGRNPAGTRLDNQPRCAYCGNRREDDGTTCPGCGAREVKR